MGLSDELSKYIPKDFGKKKKKQAAEEANIHTREPLADLGQDRSEVLGQDGDLMMSAVADSKNGSAQISIKSTAADPTSNSELIPATRHVVLAGHKKAVSALAWDAAGDMLVSGEHGPQLRFWDFGRMDGRREAFRTVEAYAGQQIHAAKFNCAGDLLLCATSDPRAKLLGRDGRTVREFRRGDMYVIDMRRTTGHVAALTAADWHPTRNDVFITASADSTVRVWNCERPAAHDQVIVAKTRTRGMRVAVTACAYSHDGALIASAQQDGGLSLWAAGGPLLRPAVHTDIAHAKGSETSCVAFAPNGLHLASRGGDDTVKLWDMRSLKTPLAVAAMLPSAGREANLIFSPSGSLILTGLAHEAAHATVAVLDSCDLALSRRFATPLDGDIMAVHWHPRIDQLAVAATSGDIAVMFNPETSLRGAMLCADKPRLPPRTAAATDPIGPILTPHALPLFRDDSAPLSGKRRRDKARDDPVQSKKPRIPAAAGHGRGGAIGVNETQHIMKSIIKDTMRDEDPREALLKYADSDPKFISPAYAGSQDNPPLFDHDSNNDPPSMRRRK